VVPALPDSKSQGAGLVVNQSGASSNAGLKQTKCLQFYELEAFLLIQVVIEGSDFLLFPAKFPV
jgi:hypothetical protein